MVTYMPSPKGALGLDLGLRHRPPQVYIKRISYYTVRMGMLTIGCDKKVH